MDPDRHFIRLGGRHLHLIILLLSSPPDCFFVFVFALVFRYSLSLNSELPDTVRAAGQQAPRVLPSLLRVV